MTITVLTHRRCVWGPWVRTGKRKDRHPTPDPNIFALLQMPVMLDAPDRSSPVGVCFSNGGNPMGPMEALAPEVPGPDKAKGKYAAEARAAPDPVTPTHPSPRRSSHTRFVQRSTRPTFPTHIRRTGDRRRNAMGTQFKGARFLPARRDKYDLGLWAVSGALTQPSADLICLLHELMDGDSCCRLQFLR